MTIASEEDPIDTLTWVHVSESGNILTLATGAKYTITQTDQGSIIKSQLTMTGLQPSDRGSYYCQAHFANGSALPRSQEINLFAQIVYTNNYPPCGEEKVESTTTSRCVLFVGEVISPLCDENATIKNTTQPPVTVTSTEPVNVTQGVVGGCPNSTEVVETRPRQPRDGEESDFVKDVVLYLAVGAAVVLLVVITLLVLCVCLCNTSCDCCSLCS